MIPLQNFLVLSALLFGIGFYGVLARRSAILILISVEIMLAAVAINFIAFATYRDPKAFSGLVFALFVIAVAAAEVGARARRRAAALPRAPHGERGRGEQPQVVITASRTSSARG